MYRNITRRNDNRVTMNEKRNYGIVKKTKWIEYMNTRELDVNQKDAMDRLVKSQDQKSKPRQENS